MRRSDARTITRVRLLPLARRELRGAYRWYDSQNPRVAEEFQAAFGEALVRIAEAPLRWAEVVPGIRSFLLAQYPYTLFYVMRETHVEVIAIRHQARRPESWRDRR